MLLHVVRAVCIGFFWTWKVIMRSVSSNSSSDTVRGFRRWCQTRLRGTAIPRGLLFALLLVGFGTSGLRVWSQEAPAAQQEIEDSLDRDYRDELPRIAPLEPSQALDSFQVAPGFRIEMVAAEPLVTDPIAIDFDPDGVMYAIEMRDYSEHPDEFLGQVRRLVDTDGDGIFDESNVFADRLSWPTALLCLEGGLLVGAPPELIFLRDSDGDGVADERQVVMTGFGRSNVQGLMNCLRWGLDHRVHAAVSSSGAALRWTEDSGIDSDDSTNSPVLELRGRDVSFDWQTRSLEATAGGGQHGADFDRWGDRFVCSNSDHLRYVRYEDRYLARNPWYAAPAPTVSIAADGPQADVYRISPIEPWRIVRTRLRTQGIVPGLVEGGGRPAGYFTGATGVTLYEPNPGSDELPWAIVADVGSNLVHRKRLIEHENSYRGERIDEQSEWVASTDIWFRPVQFCVGPEGGLYIVDMYREVIEHPASLPPIIKQHLDLDSGRDRGRIYRVVPEDFVYPGPPHLSQASIETLVETLHDQRVWRRRTATRLLIERQDPRAVALLIDALQAETTSAVTKLHLLSALDGLQSLDEALLQPVLADRDPQVRRAAVRWSERLAAPSPALLRSLAAMADDESLRVRTQVAFTLGQFPQTPATQTALATIALRDFEDEVSRVAVTTSLGSSATEVLSRLIQSDRVRQSDVGSGWLSELLKQVLARQAAAERIDLLNWTESWPSEAPEASQWLEQQLVGLADDHGWRADLESAQGADARARREQAIARALGEAFEGERSAEQRAAAVYELKRASDPAVFLRLAELTAPTEPKVVQQAAIETLLARGDASVVADLLVARWPSLSPELRRLALDGLLQRSEGIRRILVGIQQQELAAGDLDRAQLARLSNVGDPQIRELAASVLETPGPRDALIEAYRESLELAGERERGAILFAKHCANCHRVGEVGFAVGPSLESFRNRGAEALVANVIDPNREINPQFLAYGAELSDGRLVVGMIESETASSVTLKMAEGKRETILRAELESLTSSGVSLMPVGLEQDIDLQAMADLIAFLMQAE